MSLPNFLCIGAQKAGTTWLHAQLSTHPDVWMPPLKELHFFNHLYVPTERKWTRNQVRRGAARTIAAHLGSKSEPDFGYVRYLAEFDGPHAFTEAWYRHIFTRPEAAGRLSGDITPAYSTLPESGVDHVRSLLGPVKIIYMLRDPLSRELSQLRMVVSRANKTALTEAQWRAETDKIGAMGRGNYAEHIPRWKARFTEEDVLFLPYGRLKTDPEGVMREVEAFLGLSSHRYTQIADRVHQGKAVEIPQDVVADLAAKVRPHEEFLQREFGREFAEACK